MPEGFTYRFAIAEDRQNVTISILDGGQDGPAVANATMDAAGVEGLLNVLGEVREKMLESYPMTLDPNPHIPKIAYASWHIFDPEEDGAKCIGLRDPRFGWAVYVIHKDHAADFIRLLQREGPSKLEIIPTAGP